MSIVDAAIQVIRCLRIPHLASLPLFWLSVTLAVQPFPERDSPKEGAVRISGGNTDAGRAEVYQGGRWGAICAHGSSPGPWGVKEADVFCRELGLRRGIGVQRMDNVANISGIIGAVCSGSEARLVDCNLVKANASADPKCLPGNDSQPANAAVRCSNFFAEEQPDVVIDNGARNKSDLQSLIAGAEHYLSCEERRSMTETSFACVIGKYTQHNVSTTAVEVCKQDLEGRCLDSVLPPCGQSNPFDLAFSVGAYIYEGQMKREMLEANAKRSQVFVNHLIKPCDGVTLMPVGLRLDRSFWEAGRQNGSEKSVGDTRLAALKALYLSPMARAFLDLDADAYGLTDTKAALAVNGAGLSATSKTIYKSLERDGIAKTNDVGLDLFALQASVREAFAKRDPKFTSKTSGGMIASRQQLPALERWLKSNKTVPSAIAAYLGGKAILHGYKAVHLPPVFSASSLAFSHWHHDRAGRRL
jgi:hypothetical protein